MAVQVDSNYAARDELGEGPHWDATNSELVRVDYLSKAVHRLDPCTGNVSTTVFNAPVSFAIPLAGQLIVGLPDRVELVDSRGSAMRTLARVEQGVPNTLLNDGKVDPAGRLFFGTRSKSQTPDAGFYRLGSTGSAEQVFNGITLSNGMGWDVTRNRFYYIDSLTWRIDVCDFDVASGIPTERRPFAVIDSDNGLPDGLCVDSEGGVWVALFGGSVVRRYSAEGDLSEVVPLPVTYPTSLAFGGPDLRTMYVTSSRHRLNRFERAEEPLAGAVLTFEPGVAGVPGIPADYPRPASSAHHYTGATNYPSLITANPRRA